MIERVINNDKIEKKKKTIFQCRDYRHFLNGIV